MTSIAMRGTSWRVVATGATQARVQQPHMNPYLAGVGLGLVLLASFFVMGRGLGASGAFKSTVAWATHSVAPAYLESNAYLSRYADGTTHPLKDWLVFEVLGVFAGALVSGLLAHRVRLTVEKGAAFSTRWRLAAAFAGGVLMAFGAALARGCTSGQALSGGALLNLGSWSFMIMVFVGGYATAYFVRRQWL